MHPHVGGVGEKESWKMIRLTFWSQDNEFLTAELPSMELALMLWRVIGKNGICITRASDGVMLVSRKHHSEAA